MYTSLIFSFEFAICGFKLFIKKSLFEKNESFYVINFPLEKPPLFGEINSNNFERKFDL